MRELIISAGLFISLDFLTGMLSAIKRKCFNSTSLREGLFNKMGEIGLIFFSVLIDYTQTIIDLGFRIDILTALCTYIILMETTSILENIGNINSNLLPEKIKEILEKIEK